MSRSLRIEFLDALYHVTTHGDVIENATLLDLTPISKIESDVKCKAWPLDPSNLGFAIKQGAAHAALCLSPLSRHKVERA